MKNAKITEKASAGKSGKKKSKIILCVTACILLAASLFGAILTLIKYIYDHEPIFVSENPAESVLWYRQSAEELKTDSKLAKRTGNADDNVFQQASLPIGNGDLGASVYGGVDYDRLIINEKTLWTGGPSASRPNYSGGNILGADENGKTKSDYYYAVRELLLQGKTKEADSLFNKLMGDPSGYGAYQCFGELTLSAKHDGAAEDYIRKLDLDRGQALVEYTVDGVKYRREYIASNPDGVIAVRITADTAKFDLTVGFSSRQGASPVIVGNSITLTGALSDNGLLYYGRAGVQTDGVFTSDGVSLSVAGAGSVTVFLAASTDYKNSYPSYRTGETAAELAARVGTLVDDALNKGYQSVKAAHEADYKTLYDRVKLDLGGVKPNLTTDKLLSRYKTVFLKSSERKYLEQLLFNYGRYLLIASSRENSRLPANLQGVWNNSNTPPWSADYHININLQMNYWAAYPTNLMECTQPLVSFIDSLREPGRVAAKNYTGTAAEASLGLAPEEYGFTANTEINPFGFTGTREASEYSKSLWSPASVAWLIHTVYEGYRFGGDLEYLRSLYPIMKEALLYFERTMLKDPISGRLVSAPAYSPEHGPITLGNTYEQSLIWQLYYDTIAAAEALGEDSAKAAKWKADLELLNPIEIGASGQIKEWYNETYYNRESLLFIGENKHRHISHLLGLFPGDLINKDKNPEWLKAAAVTLDKRGDKSTGWAMAQRINSWARIGDGDRVYELIRQLFKSGMYPNLWDAHPPFQIDGNFGYTSGVAEMVAQSHLGYIELLPSLPSAWSVGRISGIRARGGFEISADWTSGRISKASVRSLSGGVCTVKFDGSSAFKVVDINGSAVSFQALNGKIIFNTAAGQQYFIIKA